MSGPKHQHFIPQSYLKNFAEEKDGKFFVEAKLIDEEKPKEKPLSIRDICVDKNLYTIPNIEGSEKYSIEKYYAENIDAVYPEVNNWLINPDITFISGEQRTKIILTTMSLFFRTPKFLNHNERRLNLILNYAINNFKDDKGNVKLKFREYDFNFNVDNLEAVKSELKVRNKIKFLQEHLKALHEFVIFKSKAGITVSRAYEDFNLITSDNPVIMRSVVHNQFNVFDPTNIISLPLDNKHFLTIFPNTEASLTDRIFRGERDKWFVLATNFQVNNSAEDWILGKPSTVTAHIKDQKEYGAWSEDNFESMKVIMEKANDGTELNKIISEVGTFAHQKVADKLKELKQKPIYADDPNIIKTIREIEKLGFSTE